jgi:hypothetical protein
MSCKEELTADFLNAIEGAKNFWVSAFGPARTHTMVQQAVARFDSLLPELRVVGGEKSSDAKFIPIAAWYVALYGSMRLVGKTAEGVGKLVYDLNNLSLGDISDGSAIAGRDRSCSEEYRSKMREWAECTRKREYPANWVAKFISGDGTESDYGCDHSECGLVKYFETQGVPELAPCICVNDFPNSSCIGSGLRRTKTIAQATTSATSATRKAGRCCRIDLLR